MNRVGFGGGCHWCTEAVFESLRGVDRVDQGWLAPAEAPEEFSEAVVVWFDPGKIDLPSLIAVHLHTHACTSNHALRGRYRSAVYFDAPSQAVQARAAITRLQSDFDAPIITQVVGLGAFRGNSERYLHYWRNGSDRPFCQTFIATKLRLIRERFAKHVRPEGD